MVPDVFPLQPPKLEEPLPTGIKRKIGKLEEYLQKSPARAAKVGMAEHKGHTGTHCDVLARLGQLKP